MIFACRIPAHNLVLIEYPRQRFIHESPCHGATMKPQIILRQKNGTIWRGGNMAKAKPEEAQVILRLYDMRREPVMRAARKHVVAEMWPKDYEEFKAIINGYGTEPNAWFRQVMT